MTVGRGVGNTYRILGLLLAMNVKPTSEREGLEGVVCRLGAQRQEVFGEHCTGRLAELGMGSLRIAVRFL